MRTREKERLLKKLVEMKDEILNEIRYFEETQRSASDNTAGEYFTTHPADMGSVTQEREKAFWLAAHERKTLNAINEAIERIDNGSYGICDTCGRTINLERLNLIPYAIVCLECKEEMEQKRL